MVKIICVKKWDATENQKFLTLLKLNTPLTKIHQHFPECSLRQVEHHRNNLCAKYGLPRPDRLRKRHTEKQMASNAIKAIPRWDFSQDNMEVGRM